MHFNGSEVEFSFIKFPCIPSSVRIFITFFFFLHSQSLSVLLVNLSSAFTFFNFLYGIHCCIVWFENINLGPFFYSFSFRFSESVPLAVCLCEHQEGGRATLVRSQPTQVVIPTRTPTTPPLRGSGSNRSDRQFT